MKKGPVFLLTV